jgi:hypothetical protein
MLLGTVTVDPRAKRVFRPTYPSGVYDQLKARALLCGPDVKQIDLDINRTYRDNVAFRRRYDQKCVVVNFREE